LKGFPGKTFNEVNAYGKIVRQISLEPSIKGSDLHLTINSKLQNFCQDIIPINKKGSVVVLNSQDGSILSLNSNPTFNSQDFENRDSEKISSFLNDENKPLFNRAFSGFYPPGSVFKPLPALLGLEKGLINETTEFLCKGHSSIGSRNYYCWKKGGHGKVNLKKGIKESCDVYFYELAKLINIDDLSSLATEMGFNQKYLIGLSNAKSGLVPNKKWKRKTYDESWFPGETLITCIGQGANQVSPLQLATYYSSIINGGLFPKPRILKNQSVEFLGRKINEKFHKILLNALNSVVNEVGGTANKLFRDNPNYIKIAGKTGTSQVISIKESDREDDLYKEKQKEQLEKFKDHSVFVGYGPVDNPKYIASVIIENGGSGSSLAAPLAHEILNFAEKNNV
jgi:penicillin-binding protein 2